MNDKFEIMYKNKSGIIGADKLGTILDIPSLQKLCDNLQGYFQDEKINVSLVGGINKIFVEFEKDIVDDETRKIIAKIDNYLKFKGISK